MKNNKSNKSAKSPAVAQDTTAIVVDEVVIESPVQPEIAEVIETPQWILDLPKTPQGLRIDLKTHIYAVQDGARHENLYYARIEAKQRARDLNRSVQIFFVKLEGDVVESLVDTYTPPAPRGKSQKTSAAPKVVTTYAFGINNDNGRLEAGANDNLYYSRIDAKKMAKESNQRVEIWRRVVETGEFHSHVDHYDPPTRKIKPATEVKESVAKSSPKPLPVPLPAPVRKIKVVKAADIVKS